MTKLFNLKLGVGLVLMALSVSLASTAHAGKFSFFLGYGLGSSAVDSYEISGSSGGNYASSVDLGGTYFHRRSEGTTASILSFDVFSSLDSVQESNFLFAAGARVFGFFSGYGGTTANSFGAMAGLDVGGKFATGVPTALIWSFDYSPNLLNSGALEDLIQSSLTYEILFTPVVIGQVAYRYGSASFDEGKRPGVPEAVKRFENSLGFGIKIRF